MQKTLHQLSFGAFLFFFSIIILSFSSNPPNGNTGGPGEQVCSNCHGGGSQTGEVDILGVPNPIQPGQTYTLSVVVRKLTGAAARAGFQLMAIDTNTASSPSIGTFGNPGPSVNIQAQGNREYAEHMSPELTYPTNCQSAGECEVTYTVDWTAPSNDLSSVYFFAVGNVANGSGSGGDRIVTSNIQDVSLPITLSKFYLEKQTEHINVHWETTSEVNSDYFEVLRSLDTRNYDVIGNINAAGNSNDTKQYTFVDDNPNLNRVSYYKLRQFDLDGKMDYSNIEYIEFLNDTQTKVLVYPNPLRVGECIFVEYITPVFRNKIKISLFDQNGQVVHQDLQHPSLAEGLNKIIVDSKTLNPGIYYLLITSGAKKIVSQKVLVM